MSAVPDSLKLEGARFAGRSLRGARFIDSDLSHVRARGVLLDGADFDSPWLLDGEGSLVVNGVDVAPLVEVELNRRFPGRAQRRAEDAEGLRGAWGAVEASWRQATDRASALPDGAVDVSVEGEWSFSQTLRHLVFATDAWLSRGIQGAEEPFHPLGQPRAGAEDDGVDLAFFASTPPPYEEVLAVRSERLAQVREFLASVDDAGLDEERRHPWSPEYPETVRSCLHVILEEEWEHLRYALRDLDALDDAAAQGR
ncbi:DinB family protein [Micrococcus luteus]|uniref:DinB family protein n=1 Tax=Micrococcus luteus TaxID=1270 RepID=A0AAP3AJR6_MICLU|nr:DinB family protein [Micrococcus luteus]MCV7576417.1 DinB family protein [Micrococcus luteus]MCV7583306.1 DinB family protein [Micrococcus luteus]MCV7588062.1 DinB family protein [Micrococcus luteus]MCV7629193.1 DinB family protein [Micrococcus luteus]TKD55287.1 DinB family protein [Micrococcus luteus]